jgi:hypothetical protein
MNFKSSDVALAVRKFSNLANDVLNANHQTFSDFFGRFLRHCETEPDACDQDVRAPELSHALSARANRTAATWSPRFSVSQGRPRNSTETRPAVKMEPG